MRDRTTGLRWIWSVLRLSLRRKARIGKAKEIVYAVAFGLFLLTSTCTLQATTFKAAVAKADITPPPGLSMYGFLDRINGNKLSTGTLDPLYARVLVLEVGEKRLALVTLDLGRTFNEAELAQLRQEVRSAAGVSHLIITASHTHSGPNILDVYPGDQAPAWETTAIKKITAAVLEACEHLVEARIGTGRGEVYIGYNRREIHPDGSVSMLWTNPRKQPTFPIDPTVLVMRIDNNEGRPLALLVNYACHPVVLGADNLQYSADFVGIMANTVEAGFDNAPLCFYLQGGSGDINPYHATTLLSDGAMAKRDWTGKELGNEVVRVAKTIHTDIPREPGIDFSDDVLSFPLRWNAKTFRAQLLDSYGPRVFEDHADLWTHDPPPDHLELHVTTLLLNKRIALIGMPGEPFVNFQINWRDRCPVPDALFLGYANGYFDYFPTIEAATQGGYGANDSNTYVEIGAGERMLRQALTRVYEMLGKLHDSPERD
jgi:neutral/alkaline ceramidase-like enzyme